jgi:hypothetical protein
MITIVCNSFSRYVDDAATGIRFYSRQENVVNTYLERNLLIRQKNGKKIYVIERFVVNALCKIIISCLWAHAGARLVVDEKKIIFRSVTFQNVVQNSYNTQLVTHLQVNPF